MKLDTSPSPAAASVAEATPILDAEAREQVTGTDDRSLVDSARQALAEMGDTLADIPSQITSAAKFIRNGPTENQRAALEDASIRIENSLGDGFGERAVVKQLFEDLAPGQTAGALQREILANGLSETPIADAISVGADQNVHITLDMMNPAHLRIWSIILKDAEKETMPSHVHVHISAGDSDPREVLLSSPAPQLE